MARWTSRRFSTFFRSARVSLVGQKDGEPQSPCPWHPPLPFMCAARRGPTSLPRAGRPRLGRESKAQLGQLAEINLTGACWFDTVDCYDRSRDDWTTCPSLTRDKGSLAGVSVNGRIYAFGGGDGSQCFSDVEIFDPPHGKWIKNQPMLEKRFSLAGVALNGVIYAVGGFNGAQYLSSAERLDPREPNWKMLPMMSARRGCHTLAVLNEKIFSIGGYDTGAKAMVATVEMYEPRMPSWVMVEPMSYTRGYHSSAVLGGSIFTFGGVKGEGDTILDAVERYKEGCGWVTTGLKSIGKRCYCSAIVH